MSAHPGRTPAMRRVLDEIGCGNPSPMMADATRDALLREGLIVEISPIEDRRGGMILRIRRFDMPVAAHIAWCDAMSEVKTKGK